MLFSRRKAETPWQKVRIALWPRRSFMRSWRYVLKRILRLRATPHAIAVGVAAGVFSAFNPFLGIHTAIAVAIAWALSGNLIAAAVSTWFGNPATYPFIWAGTWELGNVMLGHPAGPPPGRPPGHGLGRLAEIWEPLLKPMLVGSVPLGLVAALVSYFIARGAAKAFAERRAHRLEAARRPTETSA